MTHIIPLHKVVAIDPIFEANTFDSSIVGLVKPDKYKGRCKQGIVKYVGEGCEYVKPLDYVFFSAYAGTLWEYKGELLILMPEDKLACRLERHNDDVDIPGLFFKGESNEDKIRYQVEVILNGVKDGMMKIDDAIASIRRTYTNEDRYWPATYAMAVSLISDALTPLPAEEIDPKNVENVR